MLMIVVAVALQDHQHERGDADASAEQHAEAAERHAQQTAPIVRVIQEPPANPNAERNEWREERDLQAQRDMAQWAFLMFVVSALALGVAVAGILLLKQTLDAAHAANKGFADAARRQLRAYVSIEGARVQTRLLLMQRIECDVVVRMKNCGQTPARNVVRTMEVFGAADAHRRVQISKKRLDIGPGLYFEHRYKFTVPDGAPQPVIEVSGTVDYTDFSGDRWRIPYRFSTMALMPVWIMPQDHEISDFEQSEEQRV